MGGHTVIARRVLAATGLVDELPEIDGLAEHWGGDVIHCPFCHGFEVRDRRIVRVVTHPMGLHPAGNDGHVAAVELTNGDRINADAVVIGARFRVRADGATAVTGRLCRGQRDGPEPAGVAACSPRQLGGGDDQLWPGAGRRPSDPDAYLRVEDFAAAPADAPTDTTSCPSVL